MLAPDMSYGGSSQHDTMLTIPTRGSLSARPNSFFHTFPCPLYLFPRLPTQLFFFRPIFSDDWQTSQTNSCVLAQLFVWDVPITQLLFCPRKAALCHSLASAIEIPTSANSLIPVSAASPSVCKFLDTCLHGKPIRMSHF